MFHAPYRGLEEVICPIETLINLKQKINEHHNFLYFHFNHMLYMEVDLQSLFGLHVHSRTHWLRPRNPPPPPFGLIFEGAIGQPR
jgi:hypothetical protein